MLVCVRKKGLTTVEIYLLHEVHFELNYRPKSITKDGNILFHD